MNTSAAKRSPPAAHLLGDRYRTAPEARIRDMLLLGGFAFELAAGGRAAAEQAVAEALEGWIRGGLGHRLTGEGERLFDPVEVLNHLKWAGLAGEDGFWAERYVATGRALVRALEGEARPRRFEVRLSRRFDLSRVEPGRRVRLRLPLPLGPAEVEPLVAGPLDAELVQEEGRIEARLAGPADGEVEFGAQVRFTAGEDGADPQAPLPEGHPYLRANEGLIRVTPRVAELAGRLSERGEGGWSFATRAYGYMLDALACGAVRYDQVDPGAPGDWVLEHGWFDCQLGAALLVALCRARGIPARLVGGNVLYALAPTNHYWAEVWANGRWRAIDFLGWDLSAGGADDAWRTRFVGRLDPRMVTERLPLHFTGPMSVRLPGAWRMLQRALAAGVEVEFQDLAGRRVYRDQIEVREIGPQPGGEGGVAVA